MIDEILQREKELEVLKQEQQKHRGQMRENREKALLRKKRTRNLIIKGAMLEAYFPETKELEKEELEKWFQIICR